MVVSVKPPESVGFCLLKSVTLFACQYQSPAIAVLETFTADSSLAVIETKYPLFLQELVNFCSIFQV